MTRDAPRRVVVCDPSFDDYARVVDACCQGDRTFVCPDVGLLKGVLRDTAAYLHRGIARGFALRERDGGAVAFSSGSSIPASSKRREPRPGKSASSRRSMKTRLPWSSTRHAHGSPRRASSRCGSGLAPALPPRGVELRAPPRCRLPSGVRRGGDQRRRGRPDDQAVSLCHRPSNVPARHLRGRRHGPRALHARSQRRPGPAARTVDVKKRRREDRAKEEVCRGRRCAGPPNATRRPPNPA